MKIQQDFNHALYLCIAMRPDLMLKHRRDVVKFLRGFKFDAIAFRGMSGALLAAPLAMTMKKTLMLVRKEGDINHSKRMVEGDRSCKSYVIVDDFIAGGDTVKSIYDAVEIFAPKAKCLGVFQVNRCFHGYDGDHWTGNLFLADVPGRSNAAPRKGEQSEPVPYPEDAV